MNYNLIINNENKDTYIEMQTEEVELTNMCMISKENKVLIQHRKKNNWDGIVFPGGHIEKNESIIKSVIREVMEETGLTIKNPKLCGIKQFFTNSGIRYIVFLFKASEYEGKLKDSIEGKIEWIERNSLTKMNLAHNFEHMLQVFETETTQELYYNIDESYNYF